MPGVPVPWHPIVTRRGPHTSIRASPASVAYECLIGHHAWVALRAAGGAQLDGPAWVRVVLVFARLARHRWPGRHWHAVAPDADKVLRCVYDGLSLYGLTGQRGERNGVLRNDGRVARTEITAWYAAEGEEPHAVISWGPLGSHKESEVPR